MVAPSDGRGRVVGPSRSRTASAAGGPRGDRNPPLEPPPASDLAHLRANLGVGHEPAVADRALDAHTAGGGEIAAQRWWDVRVLDRVPVLGQRLGTGEGLDRVEGWLAHVLRDPDRMRG